MYLWPAFMPAFFMRKKQLYILGLITLIIFPLIGLTIVGFVEEQPREFRLPFQLAWYWQITVGTVYGLLTGFLAWRIIRLPLMNTIRKKYGSLIKNLRLNAFEIVFISFCAGIGEELLFRGAVQPYLGIWLTAFIFVGIHGYLNPTNLKITIYGLYMTAVIAGLGYMTEDLGILSAITAHFVIDVVLLYFLTNTELNETD